MNKVEEFKNEIYNIMNKTNGILNIDSVLYIEALISRIFEEDTEIKEKYNGSIKKYFEEELNFKYEEDEV